MRIAFYAPLKPPHHATPSGDRTMARALLSALQYDDHRVAIASTLRSRDGVGDAAQQDKIFAQADAEIDRCLADPAVKAADVWLTYHNYYKAPDLIGPQIAQSLGLPYVQIESTRARKRLTGPWARFAEAAESAAEAAQTIVYMTAHDEIALKAYAPLDQKLRALPPFLSRVSLPKLGHRNGPILIVGMMRPGDKTTSYQIAAETLHHLEGLSWEAHVVGDGSERDATHALFAPFGDRVTFLGKLAPAALVRAYADASVMFWPGVNEAYGLVYLEARAAGLPVVAQDRPGVRDVAGPHLTAEEAGPVGLAKQIRIWLANPDIRIAAGDTSRQEISKKHLLPAAARRLTEILKELQ